MHPLEIFPFSKPRRHQDRFMEEWYEVADKGGVMIAEVPTGVGKTAASLSSALAKSLDEGMKVLFLTPRHSQHMIVLETVKKMRARGLDIRVADIVGKKWLCNIPGIEFLSTSEFADYCRILRNEEKCEYYLATYENGKLSNESLSCLAVLGLSSSEDIKRECQHVCPYEIAVNLAKRADVVIADYYHVFSPISQTFLSRIGASIQDCILIVDEAHNLPDRIRSNLSRRVTTSSLERAELEARKFGFFDLVDIVRHLKSFLRNEERMVGKEELIEHVEREFDYDEISSELAEAGEEVKRTRKKSYLFSLGSFLQMWKEADERFAFLMKRGSLSLLCLDPSVLAKDILEGSHASLLMSGTLRPLEMYEDLLGVHASKRSYPSPFPARNRMDIVLKSVTSRFSERGEGMEKAIASVISDLMAAIPHSMAFFFPSYEFMNAVLRRMDGKERILSERPEMSKEEKERFYRTFYSKDFVLFGVAGGSFSEGVDYPGNKIRLVGIVGLPLAVPDLETKALIGYYEGKFGSGWNYGYAYPAIIKALQAAGRSIRSEKDRGVILYMDERFAWRNYYRLLPRGTRIVSRLPVKEIVDFLS